MYLLTVGFVQIPVCALFPVISQEWPEPLTATLVAPAAWVFTDDAVSVDRRASLVDLKDHLDHSQWGWPVRFK